MDMIRKGIERDLEFGDYGNKGTLTPEAVQLKTYDYRKIHAIVTYRYDDGRTIDLAHDNVDNIDFESFGTTFEKELSNIGYRPNEVQFRKASAFNYSYNVGLYIIKKEDGSIVPYEKFLVTYDVVWPNGAGTSREETKCEAQGEMGAIEYVKHINSFKRISNIRATKVED